MNTLNLINRTKELVTSDVSKHETQLSETVNASNMIPGFEHKEVGRYLDSKM